MNSMMHWSPAGLAFAPNTLVMVEGAPAGLHISATNGGRTVIGQYVDANPATNAPARYVVDVSSFSIPDTTAHPIMTVTMGDMVNGRSTWTWVGTPTNGAGTVIPFTSFATGTPWTAGEKALAVGAGAVVIGGIAWYFWPRRR